MDSILVIVTKPTLDGMETIFYKYATNKSASKIYLELNPLNSMQTKPSPKRNPNTVLNNPLYFKLKLAKIKFIS